MDDEDGGSKSTFLHMYITAKIQKPYKHAFAVVSNNNNFCKKKRTV